MARIVFDLDGTLIDSAPDIRQMANTILGGEGRAPITLEQTREFIGDGIGVFIEKMRKARNIPDTEQDRLKQAFINSYGDAVHLTIPYPGVADALERLIAAGHSLGVCTNKPIAPCRAVLRHLDLLDYFATVWGGDSLPTHKPDPAPLHAAFDALPDGPRIYVGDSEVDAETAARAEVPFVLFTEGYRKTTVEQMPYNVTISDYAGLDEAVATILTQSK
ncbi:phosphoglycolate phosphatase [Notoacmeibacter sp. MSK16QG-6]|uniref:phosphoglycolate phosphatase n=1 Tax=Notoacmeibacter sp. MSK16QG-6 TaxID=2957982 RepID=UPI0020A089EC|nr:phosphoglycolate phosphatase [Notoacmeibacter sp. MSK16QG-6]MCP1198392.1 phosphoglycolate phosphatase [Notoacmeibacter sp. MSK16QG-6]